MNKKIFTILTILIISCKVETAEDLRREKDRKNFYITYYSGELRNQNKSGCKVSTRGGRTDEMITNKSL